MPFSCENLLNQLDQPETIDWALELKNRKEAFAFLIRAVRGEIHLNQNQLNNALHMLFRMAFPENSNEVLGILIKMTDQADIKIRSESVLLAIGIVRVSANLREPILLTNTQESSLRKAVERGLTAKVDKLARKFFNG